MRSDDLSIPDFLLVKNRPARVAEKSEGETPAAPAREQWEIALDRVEPEGLRQFIAARIKSGKFMSHWLVPDGVRRFDRDVEESISSQREKYEARIKEPEKKEKRISADGAADQKTAVILFEGENPKKEGTAPHKRWELLVQHHEKTVAEFLEAGGNPVTLKNAIASGYATLREGSHENDAGPEDGGEDGGGSGQGRAEPEGGQEERSTANSKAGSSGREARAKRRAQGEAKVGSGGKAGKGRKAKR